MLKKKQLFLKDYKWNEHPIYNCSEKKGWFYFFLNLSLWTAVYGPFECKAKMLNFAKKICECERKFLRFLEKVFIRWKSFD